MTTPQRRCRVLREGAGSRDQCQPEGRFPDHRILQEDSYTGQQSAVGCPQWIYYWIKEKNDLMEQPTNTSVEYLFKNAQNEGFQVVVEVRNCMSSLFVRISLLRNLCLINIVQEASLFQCIPCLLHNLCVCSVYIVVQQISCVRLCDLVDCSIPGSHVLHCLSVFSNSCPLSW